jgi:hypothetical protein
MDDNLTRCVKQILEGKASVKSAQTCLARLERGDLKRMFPEAELKTHMDAYKDSNQYQASPLLGVSEEEAADSWRRVLAAVPPQKSPLREFGQRFMRVWDDLYEVVIHSAVMRFGVALALLMLVLIPVLRQYNQPADRSYHGEKGVEAAAPATFQFSLVNPAGKLVRPDRIITQEDTLAFRIKATRQGFCSIYIAHNDQLDRIVTDQALSKGTHDLNVAYVLSGNLGSNTVIMLFADAPIAMEERHKRRLLIEAARNAVTSMTIEGTAIYISSQQIEVH